MKTHKYFVIAHYIHQSYQQVFALIGVFFTMHTTFSFLEYVTMWAIVRAVNAIVLRDTVVKCVNATTGTVLITTEAYVAVSHLQL